MLEEKGGRLTLFAWRGAVRGALDGVFYPDSRVLKRSNGPLSGF